MTSEIDEQCCLYLAYLRDVRGSFQGNFVTLHEFRALPRNARIGVLRRLYSHWSMLAPRGESYVEVYLSDTRCPFGSRRPHFSSSQENVR